MKTELLEEIKKVELLHDEPINDNDLVDIQRRLEEESKKQKIDSEEEKKRQKIIASRETIINIIFLVVCDYFKINQENIWTDTRDREIIDVRQMIMAFAHKYLNEKFIYSYYKYSLRIIGEKVGGKDHATVLHSVKVINGYYDSYKSFRDKYNSLDNMIINEMKNKQIYQYIKS